MFYIDILVIKIYESKTVVTEIHWQVIFCNLLYWDNTDLMENLPHDLI